MKYAAEWVSVLDLSSKMEFQTAWSKLHSSKLLWTSSNPEVFLLGAFLAMRVDAFEEAIGSLAKFFDLIDKSSNHSLMEKVYLAAYGSSCEVGISKELGTDLKYEKYYRPDAIDITKVRKGIRSNFPLPAFKETLHG